MGNQFINVSGMESHSVPFTSPIASYAQVPNHLSYFWASKGLLDSIVPAVEDYAASERPPAPAPVSGSVRVPPASSFWDVRRDTLFAIRADRQDPPKAMVAVAFSPPVWDQAETNACVAIAFATAVAWRASALGISMPVVSPAYIWWYTRRHQCVTGKHHCGCDGLAVDADSCVGESCLAKDCPTHLKTAAEVISRGVPPEESHPWDAYSAASTSVQPSAKVQEEARRHPIGAFPIDVVSYGIDTSFQDLLSKGIPIVVAMTLTAQQLDWFTRAKYSPRATISDAVMPGGSIAAPMDALSSQGHAVTLVGYQRSAELKPTSVSSDGIGGAGDYYIAQDSHGRDSHANGLFLIPSGALSEKTLIEAWAVETVEGPPATCPPWINISHGHDNAGNAVETSCKE